jgi:hypothetical protein
MKYRVALWSAAGFLVSLGWFIFASTRDLPFTVGNRIAWNLAQLTQPVLFTSSVTHAGLQFYWVFLGNALTYGLIGLMFETVRRRAFHTR